MSVQETGSKNHQKSYRRRSRLEICLDLLRIVKSGVKRPTRMMYAVNVSWIPMVRILEPLVSQGFIRKIEAKDNKKSKSYYEITQRGLNVLDYVDQGKDLLRIMESTSYNA